MLIALAVTGWILFTLVACLYFVGSILNVNEEQALELYILALLFSDDFRTANRSGFEMSIEKGHSESVSTKKIVYGLMGAVRDNAKRYHNAPPGKLDTLTLVSGIVAKSSANG